MNKRKQQEKKLGLLEAWPNGELQQLLLWHDWRKTGLIFCILLMLLLDIAANSIISVVSVVGVLLLLISIFYCCYIWGMRKLQKSNQVDHPYQVCLQFDITISEETAEGLARQIVIKINPILLRLRSLLLVEDLLDSLKLLVMLCGLNILGDYINGMTLLIVGFILIFTVPKLYEWQKPLIDNQLQHLEMLLCTKKKTTVSIAPQVLSSLKSRQKSNDVQSEVDDGSDLFATYEPESGLNFSSDYNWQQEQQQQQQDIISEGCQDIKEQ